MSTQLILPIDNDQQRSFDDFVGTPNRPLIEHLKYQLDQLITSCLPRYHGAVIWGMSSAGKTHLLLALASLFEQQGGSVRWVHFEQASSSLHDGQSNVLTLLDDIESFTRDIDAEKGLLGMLEEIKQQDGFVLMTAKHAVNGLSICLPDLSSRLQALDSFELVALPEAQKRVVLKQRAHQRGIILSDGVINWLFNHTSRDLGRLLEILDQIDVVSLAQQRKVTVALIKTIVEH